MEDKKVVKIPAWRRFPSLYKRVGIYCCVSTRDQEQLNSSKSNKHIIAEKEKVIE